MSQIWTIAETHPVPPCTVVIFGASGDLAARKLLPALYNLEHCGREAIPPKSAILGFARREMPVEAFRTKAREAAARYSRLKIDEECWRRFAQNLDYLAGLDRPDGFARLKGRLEEIEKARGLPPNRIYYLSLPPEAITETVEKLHGAGLIVPPDAPYFTRIVVEKPIGHDLHSALHIISAMRKYFAESQIFRIDHYLGKETVQNLMVLRFANSIFEDFWNNRRVDHVQITVSEEEGLGTRAMYYDGAGALRDMVQNHMLQVLSLTAMEPPVSLAADAVRGAKVNAIRSLRPIDPDDVRKLVVRGQYVAGELGGKRVLGYLQEEGIRETSRTDTFVALKAMVDNWRWAGVPFYLRTGKRLLRRASTIFVQFKRVPEILFNRRVSLPPDVLAIRIQPDEGFSLEVLAKRPGLDLSIQPVRMDLRYSAEFDGDSPDAYERLLLDVMAGDHTLFLSSRFVQRSWEFVQGILDQWQGDPTVPLEPYAAGTWGPKAADDLIRADGREWYEP
ncbi:MAG TPA: glucose-6-phosphate dehydrogenase [Candidatus Binataceae bacterium]|nr:glucose-6-phosphate dehydrogenase [Candidatus Binataceae bacterium]